MTRILGIDLGKFKSTACLYQGEDAEHQFQDFRTKPKELHDLLVLWEPDRVAIEVGNQAGWICDLARALEIEIQVANPNHEGWRWKNAKRKTDRDDALKLARLSAMNQVPTVVVPERRVRQWRSLIAYRHTLIARQTAIKNSIRSILDREALSMPGGRRAWSQDSIKALRGMSRPMPLAGPDDLWRGLLYLELQALEQVQDLIARAEVKLAILADDDRRVEQLQTIPGVGPRLAEMVVATIDDPKRFKTGKQVAAYAGLVPRQFESGTMQRTGGITGQGNKLLRMLLVEVGWLSRRYNPHLREVFERICRGSKTRRKIAVVAVARRLLIYCWAMLRDGTEWRGPTCPQPAGPD